jgi:hypothetical protein
MKDSIYLYQSMITWGEKFFKQGGRPGFSIEMGPDSQIDDANRYIKFFKENYLGINNAHVPPVAYAGAKLVEFGKGSVELDFLQSLAWARDEILAGYNVPLSVTGIQEAAHLGGGTGESANKLFIYNVVKPIEELILEKFNYRIVQNGMKIYDYRVSVSHADYRDDKDIASINDMKVRNGTRLIDEVRQEEGRMPYPLGGDLPVIVTSREVVPIERLADLAEEQREAAQLANEMQKAQIEKLRQPSSKPTALGQQPQDDTQAPTANAAKNLDDEGTQQEDFDTDWLVESEAETAPKSAEELAKSIDDLFGKIARRGSIALGDDKDE